VKPHEEHRQAAKNHLRVRIVTVSTSRFAKMKNDLEYSDEAGDVAETAMKGAEHTVTDRSLVSDDAMMIRKEIRSFLSKDDDVLMLIGGTGISKRDITIETVRPYFEKELSGFGELLRSLSYDEIGSAAMLTRATMGVAKKGRLIVCLPGSPGAVRTAMEKFLGELPHAVHIANG
jgi:molybdenum cofactor biosynthesis protein B